MSDLISNIAQFGLSAVLFLTVLLVVTLAVSSSAVVSNVTAGLLLRRLGRFRVGDAIEIGEHCGRISGLALLHVELHTDNDDLIVLPNVYVISNPVTLLRDPDARRQAPSPEAQAPARTEPVLQEDEPPDPADVAAEAEKQRQLEELAGLKKDYTQISQRLLELEHELKDADPGEARRPLNLEKKKLEAALARTAKQIDAAAEALDA